jgi:hypothetical protein
MELRITKSAAVAGALAFASIPLFSSLSSAHIDMVGDVLSRGGDQKMSPCDGAARSSKVYTFEPGATIRLTLHEGVPHPSYYRIAFDDDGTDDFREPATIDPIDKGRACPFDANDQCTKGQGDYCNVVSSSGGASVLWDYLDPHVPTSFLAQKDWSYTVTLPDVECSNCTIQVIQVMEDTVHGAYCPQGNPKCDAQASLEDIYHRCIDIVLKKGVGKTPGTVSLPASNNGKLCPYAAGDASDASVPSSDAGVVVIQPSSDAGPAVIVDAGGAVSPAVDGGAAPGGGGPQPGGSDAGGVVPVPPGADGGPAGPSITAGCEEGCTVGSPRGLLNSQLSSFLLVLGAVRLWRRRQKTRGTSER